ncbi:ROK family transcriptional regulator [Microbacterium sp. NPDC055683]
MTQGRATTTAGPNNSGTVLDLIRSGGTISRVDLAARSGLTEASISRIVKQLLGEGVILETGRGESTGGKRPTLLQLNKGARHAVGMLLSDARVEYVLTDLSGAVIASAESPGLFHLTRAELIPQAAMSIDALIASSPVDPATVLGVGVATPGRQEISDYASASNPFDRHEWDWRAIQHELADATGREVSIENDSTCAAIGEYWASRAPASSDFGVVNVANGIGFGLVTRGDVYRGASSNVGEIGHMVLDLDGPECACGNRGCLQSLASTPTIVRTVLADDELTARLGLAGTPSAIWDDYGVIARAAASGDPAATAPIDAAARILGKALISLTNILDLERIVITGPALDHVGGIFRDAIADELDRRAFVRSVHRTEVALSGSGRHASALGAATLVIHERLGGAARLRTPSL